MRKTIRLGTACLLFAGLAGGLTSCGDLRAFFPAHDYETEPVELPADLVAPALLVFTKTNGFRHEEAISAGVALLESTAARRGWSMYHTESGAVFNEAQLARFAATVWLNTSGDTLNEEQKTDFKAWLEQGGGFVGIHGAGGDFSYDWDWYVEELIGAQFIGHIMGPQFQDATVIVERDDHPATTRLPRRWTHNEEWYSFDASVADRPGFEVLARVDESTYSPRSKILWMDGDLAMGDHPVVWSHCVGRGRALFSALGHQEASYAGGEPAALIAGAVSWAMRLEGSGCD